MTTYPGYPNDQANSAGAIPVWSVPKPVVYTVAASTTIAAGGTSQTLFASTTNGAWITNPSTATELLYINPTGGVCLTSESGSTFGIQAGQTFTIGKTALPVTVNALTTGHPFVAVSF